MDRRGRTRSNPIPPSAAAEALRDAMLTYFNDPRNAYPSFVSLYSGAAVVRGANLLLRRGVELCRHSKGKGEGAMPTLLATWLVSGTVVHWMIFVTIFVAYLRGL